MQLMRDETNFFSEGDGLLLKFVDTPQERRRMPASLGDIFAQIGERDGVRGDALVEVIVKITGDAFSLFLTRVGEKAGQLVGPFSIGDILADALEFLELASRAENGMVDPAMPDIAPAFARHFTFPRARMLAGVSGGDPFEGQGTRFLRQQREELPTDDLLAISTEEAAKRLVYESKDRVRQIPADQFRLALNDFTISLLAVAQRALLFPAGGDING
jgi:hypothetical protein